MIPGSHRLFAVFGPVLCGLAFLAGCSKPAAETGPVPLPVIRTIALDTDVVLVRKPFVKLPDDVWPTTFLGGEEVKDGSHFQMGSGSETSMLIRVENKDSHRNQTLKETKYKDFLAKSGIDMKKLVYDAFKTELSQENSTLKFAEKGADARMVLNISFYGIHESFPLSGLLKPVLVVEAELFVGSTRVWKGRESIQTANDVMAPPHKMPELEKDPKILETSYMNMAAFATARMIGKLKSELPATK